MIGYWSSTTFPNNAWLVVFGSGYLFNTDKGGYGSVRAVWAACD